MIRIKPEKLKLVVYLITSKSLDLEPGYMMIID